MVLTCTSVQDAQVSILELSRGAKGKTPQVQNFLISSANAQLISGMPHLACVTGGDASGVSGPLLPSSQAACKVSRAGLKNE